MATTAYGGSVSKSKMGGNYGNYSSDLDRLRELGNAAAQQVATSGSASAIPDAGFDPGIYVGDLNLGPDPNTDYLALAQQMFAPQTQYLDQQEAAAKKRASENQAALKGVYGQTVKDILGMAGGIKGNFNEGIASTNNAYNQAIGQVGSAFGQSEQNQMDILKRLGIEQAAPHVAQQNNDARALLQGIMAANNQGSTNALRQMQQGALTFNTEQGNITRQAGAEAQTGMRQLLENALSKIAGTKADLLGQINQSAQGLRSDAQKQRDDANNRAYMQLKDQRDFNYQMGKDKADYDLQLQKLAMSGQDQGATDPLGKVYSLANQVYGNSQSASNAVRLVSEAFNNSNPTTAAQFIQAVMDRAHRANANVNDEGNLQRLAALMFNELYGKQSPSPFGG